MTAFKIVDLKDGHTNVDLEGEIISVGESRSVVTRYGKETKLTHATIKDDSANILLILWGDQCKGIEVGKNVKIEGGFIKSWKGAKQLSIGRNGKLEILSAAAARKAKRPPREIVLS
ncbi:MAG: DNA-binding protein [archaeon]